MSSAPAAATIGDGERTKKSGTMEWNVAASEMSRNTFNPIRAIVDGMKLRPNPELTMIPLSIGDPTIFGNLFPPPKAPAEVIRAVESGNYNGYAPSAGYQQSREAVAQYLSHSGSLTSAENVFLTSGCSSALEMAISVLADRGQNVLIPRPGFSLYKTLCLSQGIEVKSYECLPDRMWEIDLKHLHSLIDDLTRAIVVVNPSNPCGSNFSKDHVRSILSVASAKKVPLIADEIYAGMVYDSLEYTSFASQSEDVPILTCGGISKLCLVPGWRLGWVVIHDKNEAFGEKIRSGLMRLTQRILGPCTLIQAMLPKLLEDHEASYQTKTMSLVQSNAEYALHHISVIKGLEPIEPQAAFYMMVRLVRYCNHYGCAWLELSLIS